jgi:SAM-dependent methyltransferase
MTDTSSPTVGDRYILPTGKTDASRLDVIHAVYGAVSYRGLDDARIDEARRVADIGCGTGTLSRWMASRLGPDGAVDAIDIAEAQVEIARNAPVDPAAAPIRYGVGSAYGPGLEQGIYDLVFCRLVLCHLKEPGKALDQMARLLRPGGRIVLVDMDIRDIFTMPACDAFPSFHRELTTPLEAKLHVDYSIGLRLTELLVAAGLSVQSVVADQPIYRSGPEKFLWTDTWRSVLQRAVDEKVIDHGRGLELIERMERRLNETQSWMAVAKMFAVVGARPA